MLQSIRYCNMKTTDCNIFRALVFDAWRTDVYRAEGQNWPLLQASHLFSGTSFSVHNNIFIYAYKCVCGFVTWSSNLKWFILLHYVYKATNKYPSNTTLSLSLSLSLNSCSYVFQLVLSSLQGCTRSCKEKI
jgi:hypothetical protein